MKELRADKVSLELVRAELATINHTITSHATTAEVQLDIEAQLRTFATLQDLASSFCFPPKLAGDAPSLRHLAAVGKTGALGESPPVPALPVAPSGCRGEDRCVGSIPAGARPLFGSFRCEGDRVEGWRGRRGCGCLHWT